MHFQANRVSKDPATSRLRPIGQHFLSGMGATVPRATSTSFLAALLRLRGRSRSSKGESGNCTIELGFRDSRPSEQCKIIDQLTKTLSKLFQSNKDIVPQFETQWRTAMQSFISECTLSTLQCALLAQIYCIQKKDSRRLVYYRGIAVGVSQHLGLHRSQQALCHSVLNCETRKKIFWTVYTLDW